MRTKLFNWWIANVFLVVLFLQGSLADYAPVDELTCRDNRNVDMSTNAAHIFESCRRDNSHLGIMFYLSQQAVEWFNTNAYLQYLVLLIVVIPYIVVFEDQEIGVTTSTEEGSAKARKVRIGCLFLLFRIGLVYSMSFWLNACIQHENPCECANSETREHFRVLGRGIWGMPSTEAMTTTVFAVHFAEVVNIPVGLALATVLPLSQIFIGTNSIGQVLVGMLIGGGLHIWLTRTPGYIRLIDFVLNLFVGVLVFFIVKTDYRDLDFSWSAGFIEGIIWQCFALALMWVIYDKTFIKNTLRKPTSALTSDDFYYEYYPLNSRTVQRAPSAHENAVVFGCVVALYGCLTISRICAPFLDDVLDVSPNVP